MNFIKDDVGYVVYEKHLTNKLSRSIRKMHQMGYDINYILSEICDWITSTYQFKNSPSEAINLKERFLKDNYLPLTKALNYENITPLETWCVDVFKFIKQTSLSANSIILYELISFICNPFSYITNDLIGSDDVLGKIQELKLLLMCIVIFSMPIWVNYLYENHLILKSIIFVFFWETLGSYLKSFIFP